MKLRVGRKVGRTLYYLHRESPSDGGALIGMVDTPELAKQLVKDSALAEFVRERIDNCGPTEAMNLVADVRRLIEQEKQP